MLRPYKCGLRKRSPLRSSCSPLQMQAPQAFAPTASAFGLTEFAPTESESALAPTASAFGLTEFALTESVFAPTVIVFAPTICSKRGGHYPPLYTKLIIRTKLSNTSHQIWLITYSLTIYINCKSINCINICKHHTIYSLCVNFTSS